MTNASAPVGNRAAGPGPAPACPAIHSGMPTPPPAPGTRPARPLPAPPQPRAASRIACPSRQPRARSRVPCHWRQPPPTRRVPCHPERAPGAGHQRAVKRRRDAGSVTLLAPVFMALLVLLALAVADLGAVAVARVGAQAAADLAALAALTGSDRAPADLAAAVAVENGARLVSCTCGAADSVVAVTRDVRLVPGGPSLRVTARAKAVAPLEPLYPDGLPDSAGPGRTDPRTLLANRRLELSPNARADLAAGVVDPRLVALLDQLLRRHRLAVSVFRTGHSRYVAGTRVVSKHVLGRAADIWKVDGGLVRPGDGPSLAVTEWLGRLPEASRPSEVGSPFPQFEKLPGHFSNAAHLDHLHLAVG
jgi:secretion/DNA translocation related TadE-like protein